MRRVVGRNRVPALLYIKATVGLRVTSAEEAEGLDIGEHGTVAYPEELPAAEPHGAPTSAGALTSPSAT